MLDTGPLVSTFSIVGYDPQERAWGIAIASRFLAVGAQTCWGEGTTGVLVIQAYLNAQNGVQGVELLREGHSASQVIERLMAADPHHELRQMAVIDRSGRVAAYTGEGCAPWAGHIMGTHCTAQGNMLLSGEGCQAMVEHFTHSQGPLARRLVDALAIGDTVGGDSRGRQAAALRVVRPREETPFDVFNEPTIDLRVDDHANPFAELSRLLDLYELLYYPTTPAERLPLNASSVSRLQTLLVQRGYYTGAPTGVLDDPTREAMKRLGRMENFHRRLPLDAAWLDRRLLEHLEATLF